MSSKTRDFTTGSISKHLIAFAIPMFMGNLLQALYNVIDSIWVGRFLGPDALASVSVSFPIIFILVSLVMGITMGTTTLVGQYYGAKKPELMHRTIGNSLLLLTLSGVVITIFGISFSTPMLRLINTPPEILAMADGYLRYFMAGILWMFWYNCITSILRGLGDSKTPLRFLVYSTLLNIILDPLLIFGIGPFPVMGVNGAALATIISQGLSAIISIRYLFFTSGLVKLTKELWVPDYNLIKIIIKIGLPTGIQQTLVSFSALIVSSLINLFGKTAVAGFGAAVRIDHFAIMPAMSIGLAVTSLVAQNIGAGKEHRVKESVYWSALLASAITGIVLIAALIIPELLLSPFTTDTAVLQAGTLYLRYIAFSYIPLSLMFTLGGVFRGAGDTMANMIITLISLWLIRVPLATYLSNQPTLGIRGIWIAMTASPFAGLLLNYFYYRWGRWRNAAVVKKLSND